jgi:formylglycine-generating enzyme
MRSEGFAFVALIIGGAPACGSRTGLPVEVGDEGSIVGAGASSPGLGSGSESSSSPGSGGSSMSTGSSGGAFGSSSDAATNGCAPGGAGLTNCGANSESCCTSPEVTGGTYYRTYADYGAAPFGLADPATVSTFRLDKYLVTVGRFRQFVAAWNGGVGYTPPAGSGKHTHLNGGSGLNATAGGFEPGWVATDNVHIAPTNANLACDPASDTWTPSAGTQENLPIHCVNWYEAYAFCIWDGGFLPSEAEWEYAAAGGSQQREYPWGSTDPGYGNQYAIYDCRYPIGSAICTGVANIAPVGTATLGAGLWGQLDLAGEIDEWNLDWSVPYADPCTDCADTTTPAAPSGRVIRGGAFSDGASFLLPTSRDSLPPMPTRVVGLPGVRCARTP